MYTFMHYVINQLLYVSLRDDKLFNSLFAISIYNSHYNTVEPSIIGSTYE